MVVELAITLFGNPYRRFEKNEGRECAAFES